VATPGGSSSVTLASPGIGTTPVSVSKPPVSAKKKKTATIVTPKLVCTKAGLKMKQVKQKLQFEEDTECKKCKIMLESDASNDLYLQLKRNCGKKVPRQSRIASLIECLPY